MTNRDFYLAVNALARKNNGNARSLEEYLRSLWHVSRELRATEKIPGERFLKMLADAFTAAVPSFDDAWRAVQFIPKAAGFARWENQILRQITDLRAMDEAGTLRDEMRFFGIFSPRGSRWYNFTIDGYLEAAIAGSMGGWEEGDDTGREFVPGEVAVMTDQGITSMNPRDVEHPVLQMEDLPWEMLASFLASGQSYE